MSRMIAAAVLLASSVAACPPPPSAIDWFGDSEPNGHTICDPNSCFVFEWRDNEQIGAPVGYEVWFTVRGNGIPPITLAETTAVLPSGIARKNSGFVLACADPNETTYRLTLACPTIAGLALHVRIAGVGWVVSEVSAVDVGLPATDPADFDLDYDVDLGDLGTLLANYGTSAAGDVDGDGDTDLNDLAGLLSVFGTSCGE